MRTREMSWTCALILAAFAGIGCDPDGGLGAGLRGDCNGRGPEPLAIAGTWHFGVLDGPLAGLDTLAHLDQTLSGEVFGLIAGDVVVKGTVTRDSATLVVEPGDGMRIVMSATPALADELAVAYDVYEGDAFLEAGTARLRRHQTQGAFSASGEWLLPVNCQSDTGGWGEAIAGEEGPIGSMVVCTNAHYGYRIQFYECGQNLAVGEFTVTGEPSPPPGQLYLEFSAATAAGAIYDNAQGGTVTITKYDSSGIAGSFDLTFGDGERSLSGSFDVPWDIVAVDMPDDEGDGEGDGD